ncbi:hypothetical protein RCC89_16880 [Cytophagaceae bacterium ABcell3]|nr:hypothetical protein RCC89_16880 [Cytophagaceae bacterium ABcell3]
MAEQVLVVILALLTALAITVIFTSVLKIKLPKRGFWFLLVLIFLVTLAANWWVRPLGTPVYGFYWLPGLLAGVIVAFIIAATMHRDNKKIRSSTKSKIYDLDKTPEDDIKKEYPLAMGLFFWLAVALLIFIIVAAIYY